MFSENDMPHYRLSGMLFSTFSDDEILQLSVKEITNPQSFDSLMHPTFSGLYDPALGPSERDEACSTCGQNLLHCPGHMGHIQLPVNVYNPVFFKTLFQILRGSCFHCHHLYASKSVCHLLTGQLRLLHHGRVADAECLRDVYGSVLEETGGGAAMAVVFEERMNDYMTKALKDSSNSMPSPAKHVMDCRQRIVKDFIKTQMGPRGGKCPHCKKPLRPLRHEHNSKIYFSKTISRKTAAQIVMDNQERRKSVKREPIENSEEFVADAEILEMNSADTALTPEKQKHLHKLLDQMYVTPLDAQTHLRKLWAENGDVLKHLFGALRSPKVAVGTGCPTDIFFLHVVPVPPSRFRPVAMMKDKKFENPQTANLSRVISDCLVIKQILAKIQEKTIGDKANTEEVKQKSALDEIPGKTMEDKFHNAVIHLQTNVNCVIDSGLDKLSKDKTPGIKQLLEKKEGLFRKHMMGKRVDYAARSVISPDPYIGTNEIGVPDVFAKKLTYPQPVTPWNVQELRQAVINGPLVHPGAAFIVNEDGSKSVLSATDRVQREAMAKQLLTPSVRGSYRGILGPKKVYRHLKNGDVLLLNRQPTLHRPSIQAHRAHVLPGEKTLRLHYANCKAYNADFDGDEMNAHFPQNEVARAEAYTIASTDYQYLVPKDGTPLAGLIQDHMVSGTSLTIRGRSFDRWDYQQLVYGALTDKKGPVRLLRPSIVKPVQLWSGKQVVSTVLLNLIPSHKSALNLEGKAKVPGKSWIKSEARPCIYGGSPLQGENMGESQVIIRQGELLCGVLDKAHYGSTPYGLVHCCYEVYGGRMAGQLLTCLARLFTIFLQIRGFSLGVEDILCTPLGDLQRRRIMKEGAACGPEAAAAAMDVADPCNATEIRDRLQGAHLCKDDSGMKEMDLAMKSRTDDYQNKIAKCIIPNGLLKRFPDNNLQLMVQSGAKGSAVNCMQISCLLGQIELEGRRPPIMLSGRSLPSFLPYDTSPRAGGYIDGRFLTGIRPQEYFFHCMAGREGLVDTAVKTSRSGYLQRCIIKHLEGIIVNYDLTARDSDGSVVQFQYGEDGLDILKTQFLQCKQYPFLISNQEALIPIEQMRQIEKHLDTKLALKLQKQVKKWKKKHGERDPKYRTSGFLRFCALNPIQLEDADDESRRDMLVKTWRELDAVQKERLSKKCTRCPNPVLSRISTFGHFGAISENMADSMEAYIRENPDKLLQPDGIHLSPGQTSVDRFRTLVNLRYLRSLVEPGEAVGLLAAQSIGEPSTQMTLNTFHFAGRGEMNVTLGIPRLREILMVASANIKTPAMDVPVHCNVLDKAQRLKQRLNRVFLSQVLEKVNVCEYLSMLNKSNRCRMYRVRFHFLPRKMYEADFHLTPAKIIAYMERKFVRHLCDVVKKKVTDTASERLLQTAVIKARFQQPTREDDAPSQPANEDEDVSDDDQNDGDAAATKYRERQQQERDYAGEEEERQEMGDSGEAESDADLGSDEDNELMAVQGVEELPVAGAEVLAKKAKKGGAEMREMDATRLNSVLSSSAMVAEYKYDVCREEWCEVTLKLGLLNSKFDMTSLIETEARRSVVYQTPGIARCFLTEVKQGPERGTHRLKTEGVNMMEIFKYDDVLDLDRLYSNDIHAVANMYGIEAAGRVIVKEIKDVFAAYGIEVDPRHLSLVADYMTFEGVYKPFNRIGMESSASPLQKMSFETTMHFLKSATLSGDRDDLKSPSARIVAGQLVSGGTGCFDLLQPLN